MFKQLLKVTSIFMVLSALWGGLEASAQNRAISGQVIDAGKQPVIRGFLWMQGDVENPTYDPTNMYLVSACCLVSAN